jgi:GT2 family glycosyltransferase
LSSRATPSHPLDSSESPSVLIVVLNWNSYEETITAVKSISSMDYPNCRTVVIDNGSMNNSAEQLEKVVSDRVEFIPLPENLGFTGGCNVGLDLALRNGDDYVWLLNSDAVTDVNTLSSLVRVAEADKTIGLVSPMIASLDEPSKLLNVGGIYEPEIPYYRSTKDIHKAREWAASCPERIMLQGTALLIRVSMVRQIGPLDPEMFAYWEDTDISLRSIKAGFRNVVDFGSTIYHKEKTIDGRYHDLKPHYWYYMARNEIRFWKKHANFKARLKPLWWQYGGLLEYLKHPNVSDTSRQAILAGLWHGWLSRTGSYHRDIRMPRILGRLIELHSRVRKT